jgi:hypothetical protein
LNKCEAVHCELVIARGDPPTLLDVVEESLDEVSSAIKMWAEADWLPSIASGRNVGPSAPFVDKGSDPVRVISPIGQQH